MRQPITPENIYCPHCNSAYSPYTKAARCKNCGTSLEAEKKLYVTQLFGKMGRSIAYDLLKAAILLIIALVGFWVFRLYADNEIYRHNFGPIPDATSLPVNP